MIGVMIVPTGIGAELGGHAGDANPAAKLIAKCCDKFITHPNVVNAADYNEMPENTLYVEGSMLDRFLQGEIELKEVYQNKILVVVNAGACQDTINAVHTARHTIGVNAAILELSTPLEMIARMLPDGTAAGVVAGQSALLDQISVHSFDALAIHTPIKVKREVALNYYRKGGVNPWGGVEAKASKLIAKVINKPVAHAPLETTKPEDAELYNIFNARVDPRISAEATSSANLHCVLKGLNQAPRIGKGLSVNDVNFMVSPYGCFGPPHEACLKAGIPVIVVKENTTVFSTRPHPDFIVVDNYLEAAGVIMSWKAGVTHSSVRRPVETTLIKRQHNYE